MEYSSQTRTTTTQKERTSPRTRNTPTPNNRGNKLAMELEEMNKLKKKLPKLEAELTSDIQEWENEHAEGKNSIFQGQTKYSDTHYHSRYDYYYLT